ncbi:MAG: hypothetical protein AAF211_19680 [Myxococcota bacterium]
MGAVGREWAGSMFLVPAIPALREVHPHLQIELLLSSAVVDLSPGAMTGLAQGRPARHDRSTAIPLEPFVSSPTSSQLGIFGATSHRDAHVVSAHTRVRANGTVVHVGEHMRWNGKKGPRRIPEPSVEAALDAQADLFLTPFHLDEIEQFPGAWQLPLWRR